MQESNYKRCLLWEEGVWLVLLILLLHIMKALKETF
jgi:hypothetical protein